jgi:outer membrane lipoprotein SlyB
MIRLPLRPVAVVAVLALGGGLAACETPGPYAYAPFEAGRAVPLEPATVVKFRPVVIGGQTSGAGLATGAIVGGASGAAIGGDAAGAIVGTLVGAVLGNAVEHGATRHNGFAYDVRMSRSGRILEIVQPDPYPIPVNAPVYVSFGPITRIIPASAYGAPPGAPPPPPSPPRQY